MTSISMKPRKTAAAPLFKPPGWAWRQFGEIGWWVRPEWKSALLDENGLKLEKWRFDGTLTTVKTGPHRVVYRANLPEGAVYIKHYKVPSWREMLRQWFRRGKGRNEAKRARKLARIGIPTITPIALGEQRKRAFLFENYLISPEIPGARPLDEFVERHLPTLPAHQAARIQHALSRQVARLTARLHNAGLVHQDFHPGNLLVRVSGLGRIELAMIDLDALRRRKRLDWQAVRDNLALLNHYFWFRCARADRLRFLKHYLEARGNPSIEVGAFARTIEQATREWAERLWKRWARRCRGTNKYFYVMKTQGAWGVASRALDPDLVRRMLHNLDLPIDDESSKRIKQSRTTTVAEVVLAVDGRPTPVIYKRFNVKKWLEPIWNLFRPTRGWRSWQAAQHLASRGVPTPRNLLYAQREASCLGHWWSLGPPRESYVVTLKAVDARTLGECARVQLPQFDSARRRRTARTLTLRVARLIRTLHDRSLSHRDLKSANILVEGDIEGDPHLSLIDLVGVELQHPLSRRRRVRDLARLYLSLAQTPGRSRTDYLRFLKAYLPWSRVTKPNWKTLWAAVDKAAGVKRIQNAKRKRPLS